MMLLRRRMVWICGAWTYGADPERLLGTILSTVRTDASAMSYDGSTNEMEIDTGKLQVDEHNNFVVGGVVVVGGGRGWFASPRLFLFWVIVASYLRCKIFDVLVK